MFPTARLPGAHEDEPDTPEAPAARRSVRGCGIDSPADFFARA